MDSVVLRSGRVDCILGTNVVDSSGKISDYTGVSSNTDGNAKYKDSPWSTYQAVMTTTSGNGTATVNIYTSNDGVHWNTTALGTITIGSSASGTSDGFTSVAPWKYIKATLTNLTGTGATCYVLMGI